MAQVKASYSRNSATKHTGVDNLFDPARVEGLVGTCVDVARNPVVLNDVDTSTPVPTAVADDDMLLLNTCVDGVGVAVLVILEVVDDVNISVVAALVAEDDVLLLKAAAEADVEVLVPPAVLGNAVSATVEGPGVLVFAALAVLDVDGDELLDPARAEVLLGSDGVGVVLLVRLKVVDDVNISVVAVLVAEDDVLLLEAAANADVEVLVPPAVLRNAVSATVEGPGVLVFTALAVLDVDEDELLDPARAEVLRGTGVDFVMNLVVLDDVDVNALVLTAVADDDVLLLEAVDAEVEVLASPALLQDVAFASGKNPNEPSSPVKLGAGLASLAPIGVSMHCGGVVGPVESATIEVQVSTEVKSDSAWSDTGHGTGEEYTASPLRVITYPPPHQTRPPILITVETNTTALDITNKTAILFCMSPTCVDAHYLYFGKKNKHTPASTLQDISSCST